MNEGIIKDTYEVILKEMQTILSVLYLFMVGIGMVFTYQKYANFGINIFNYADIFDFLIAPFSDLVIIFFTAGSLILTGLFLLVDSYWAKNSPRFYSKIYFGWNKKSWFVPYRLSGFLILFLTYIYISSDVYGKFKRDEILAQPIAAITFSNEKTEEGIIIGKTKEVIFFLHNDRVKVIPLSSSVREIELNNVELPPK